MERDTSHVQTGNVQLRDVIESDLPIFFEQQLDLDARHMAAFTSRDSADRDAFMEHWAQILDNVSNINKTILFNDQVAGNIASYEDENDQREVGYWIGKPYWGMGIASRALSAFLHCVKTRPLYARVAKDNIASLRVLEKCGFTICGEDKEFSNARGEEVEEFILSLGANESDVAQ